MQSPHQYVELRSSLHYILAGMISLARFWNCYRDKISRRLVDIGTVVLVIDTVGVSESIP